MILWKHPSGFVTCKPQLCIVPEVSVFSKVSGEDALFFREAMRDGVFAENIELLHNAFVTDWRETEINNVRVLNRSTSWLVKSNAEEVKR